MEQEMDEQVNWKVKARKRQLEFFDSLGSREYDEIEKSDLFTLKKKVAYATCGTPNELPNLANYYTGYTPENLHYINKICHQIIVKSDCDTIRFGCVILILFYNGETSETPVFKIGTKERNIFIDFHSRVYEDWDSFMVNNTLPACEYCFPIGGDYYHNKEKSVNFEWSPTCNITNQCVVYLDSIGCAVSVGTGVVAAASLCVYVAPVFLAASGTATACSSLYGVSRSVHTLYDRYNHGQSIGLQESWGSWLAIGSSAFGAVTAKCLSAAQNATSLSTFTKSGLYALNASSLLFSGFGFVNSLYICKEKYDKGTLNSKDIFDLSCEVMFFFNAVANVRATSELIKSMNSGIPQTQGKMTKTQKRNFRRRTAMKQAKGMIPSKESVNSMPSKEPVNSLQSKEPVNSLPSNEPVKSMPSKEPVNSVSSKGPVNSKVSKEPVNSVPSKGPVNSLPSKEPVKNMPSKEPVNSVPSKEPVNSLPSKEPVQSMPSKEPVNSVPSKGPVNSKVSKEPVNSVSTKEPVNSLPSKEPVKNMPSKEPVNSVPSKEPVNSLPSKEPVQSMPSKEPVNSVPSKGPVNSKVSKEPVNSVPTKEPVNSVPSKGPVNSKVSKEPVNSVPTKGPVNSLPSKEQVKLIPSNEPVNSLPSKELAKSMPSKEPVQSMPSKEPGNSMLSKEPVKNMSFKKPVKNIQSKEPVKSIPSKEPVKNMLSKEPVNSMQSKEPINSMPSKETVNSVPSKGPVNSKVSKEPVKSMPSKEPVKSMPSKEPVNSVPSKGPVNSKVSKEPVNSVPSKGPVNSMPSKEPVNSMPYNVPVNSPNITIPFQSFNSLLMVCVKNYNPRIAEIFYKICSVGHDVMCWKSGDMSLIDLFENIPKHLIELFGQFKQEISEVANKVMNYFHSVDIDYNLQPIFSIFVSAEQDMQADFCNKIINAEDLLEKMTGDMYEELLDFYNILKINVDLEPQEQIAEDFNYANNDDGLNLETQMLLSRCGYLIKDMCCNNIDCLGQIFDCVKTILVSEYKENVCDYKKSVEAAKDFCGASFNIVAFNATLNIFGDVSNHIINDVLRGVSVASVVDKIEHKCGEIEKEINYRFSPVWEEASCGKFHYNGPPGAGYLDEKAISEMIRDIIKKPIDNWKWEKKDKDLKGTFIIDTNCEPKMLIVGYQEISEKNTASGMILVLSDQENNV